MIKLYGFPLSNYFNKVKFVLLEHDIPFEEVRVNFGQDEATLAHSPLGKVPYIADRRGAALRVAGDRRVSGERVSGQADFRRRSVAAPQRSAN